MKAGYIKYFYFKTLPSTNQKLYQLAEQGIREWATVYCANQTQGRGYAGNHWESAEKQNLTFSFLLRNIAVKELPYLNMWVAVTLNKVLTGWQIPSEIKWPNDIIINNKKVGGILIENRIKQQNTAFSVIGIGINLYQKKFSIPKATSVILEKPNFNKSVALSLREIMSAFQKNFFEFKEGNTDKIIKTYNQMLFMKDKEATYEKRGEHFKGILKSVNEEGKALIQIEGGKIQIFEHKEIYLKY